ncbi:MAG: hypothetical protein HYX35_00300 [Proteobacteria bacterium]|nr:hypothetical protein [Pseudomonadota bacterium]
MKNFLLMTSCLLSLSHMSYAMEDQEHTERLVQKSLAGLRAQGYPEEFLDKLKSAPVVCTPIFSASAMDEASPGVNFEASQRENGLLVVRKTLTIPYERTNFLPNGVGPDRRPLTSVELAQKKVDVLFSCDEKGDPTDKLMFPRYFPLDLKYRMLQAFNTRFEVPREEPNPHGFGVWRDDLKAGDGKTIIGSFTDTPKSSWDEIEKELLALRAQAYTECLALRDASPVPVAVASKEGATAAPLAAVDEESESSEDKF